MRVSHCEKRPQLLLLTHSHQHATYLRRLHAVPPSTVWVVPFPAAGESPFGDDHGSAEPRVAAALAAFGSGQGSEHAALTALASSRLLVPIVAVAAGSDGEPQGPGHTRHGGGDSGAEMSLPTLVGRDGRRAIPAFTCSQTLAMWRQQARPVPEPAVQVWRAAAEDACAVIVDVAGPVPIAIDGARLAALADGRPVPLPHEDPDVLTAVCAAGANQPAIAGLSVAAADDGSDMQINVMLADGCAAVAGEEAARRLGADVMASLGGRLRRGIAVAVTPAAPAVGWAEP
jgi:SseB protein N-terminal domain